MTAIVNALFPDQSTKEICPALSVSEMVETNDIPTACENHQRQDALRIIIVGGGIAGLATVSRHIDSWDGPIIVEKKDSSHI